MPEHGLSLIRMFPYKDRIEDIPQHKKWSFPLRISSVNVLLQFSAVWSHLLKKSLMENFIFCAVCRNIRIRENSNCSICYSMIFGWVFDWDLLIQRRFNWIKLNISECFCINWSSHESFIINHVMHLGRITLV